MSLVTSGRYLSDLEKEGKAFRLRPQAIDCTSLRIEVACMLDIHVCLKGSRRLLLQQG